MDFILRKIENDLSLCDLGSYEYITFLRTRIEYSLFLCLGYLWKNFEELCIEKQNSIIADLSNLSIGTTVSAIRELDRIHKEILVSKKCAKLLDDYPAIRNKKMGHGYSMADSIASVLEPLYRDLINNVPLLSKDCDIVVIKKFNNAQNTYEGIRYAVDTNGQGVRWTCPQELIKTNELEFPRTYVLFENQYYKVSPFVYIGVNSQSPFVFSSLVEKIIGKVKLCALFPSLAALDNVEYIFKELVCLSRSDGDRQFSQSNGTIMNSFTANYNHYIDVGFQKLVENFLYKNKAYVSATFWGHGGVGKTACIQKICYDLFNDGTKHFSYIAFVTAKDRIYNPKTGKIIQESGSIRSYSEVIQCIARVLFDSTESAITNPDYLEELEQRIRNFEDRVLFVIDDYETFEDSEKDKISKFLNMLDARYHKAIITTRNRRYVIGEAISCNELNETRTKEFIEAIVSTQYESHFVDVQKMLSDREILASIFKATSGRPIFIYQFIFLYMQKGYKESFINDIATSSDAQEFLYGRIFRYLSKNTQYVFATISILVDDDSRFNLNILEHVLGKKIAEKEQFEMCLEELSNQKVIELIGDTYGRVYSQEILQSMADQYRKYPQEFQHTVKNMLDSIGGKIVKGSIFEAMLEQADKSRTFGNEQETIEKYRRILNSQKALLQVKKTAVKHLADYLSNARLNTPAAIVAMEEYIGFFPDDAEIYTLYIYLLWSQGRCEKEKAVHTIQSFFSVPNHKKTKAVYLTFFALGTGYCIDFDLRYREYAKESLRKSQYSKTFNEYAKTLFDYVKSQMIKGKPSLFHNIRIALIQSIKLCDVMGKDGKNPDKVSYGLEICEWIKKSDIKDALLNQILRLEINLQKTAARNNVEEDIIFVAPTPQVESIEEDLNESEDNLWSNGRQYCVGETVEVKITGIMSYGAFATIDDYTTGLIHISAIANRYISNIHTEFALGQSYTAQIVGIDKKHKISLSTIASHQ